MRHARPLALPLFVLAAIALVALPFATQPAAVAQDSARNRADAHFDRDHNHTGDEHEGHDHSAIVHADDISLEGAQAVIAAAIAKAEEIDTKMDIAVVDAGGNLKAFVRMDGAWLGSIDIAIKKAKTARYFDMNTGDIGELSQPGGPLYNIEHSNDGLITFPGGVPLKDVHGHIIGAVGVSGSSVDNDHTVASAAADALD